MYLNSVNAKSNTAQSFARKGKLTNFRELVTHFKPATKDEWAPRKVSMPSKSTQEIAASPKNIVKKNESGAIDYVRIFDQSQLDGQKIEGTADIGGGTFKNSSAKSLNVYNNAKAENSSGIEGTYVGEQATLAGGDHGFFNIQGNGKVSDTKANYAVLYGQGKLSDSTIAEEVEANDFATIENVKADTIIMNGWFAKLKGKKNECNQLKADLGWRILNLDFRKKITPDKLS